MTDEPEGLEAAVGRVRDAVEWPGYATAIADDLRMILDAADRIERLEAALRPFAKLGAMLEGPFAPALFRDEDSAGIGGAWSENGEPRHVTFGDLRRARAALGDHGREGT